jgi:hypothetical protein
VRGPGGRMTGRENVGFLGYHLVLQP